MTADPTGRPMRIFGVASAGALVAVIGSQSVSSALPQFKGVSPKEAVVFVEASALRATQVIPNEIAMPLNEADLEAIGQTVARAVAAALPQRTFGGWIADNATALIAVLTLALAAFDFNDRLGHLEQRIDSLVGHVDDDFRILTGKIDNLSNQVSRDEGASKKP